MTAVNRSYNHILNGSLVSDENLVIPVRDMGLLRGYGVFDFLITYNGKPFHLIDHIDRLYLSAREIELSMPYSKDDWFQWTMKALAANEDGQEKWIRMILTGGIGPNGMTQSKTNPTAIVMIEPRIYCPKSWYTEGISLISAPFLRYAPRAKTLHYVDAVIRTPYAEKEGASEILYVDSNEVLECTTSNIFAFIKDSWCTPSEERILGGITRKVLLTAPSIAAQIGSIHVRKINYKELLDADEVFITASNKEILPVVAVDGNKIKNGLVGNRTIQIMDCFQRYALTAT